MNEKVFKSWEDKAFEIQKEMNDTLGEASRQLHELKNARRVELADILLVVSEATGEKPATEVVIAAIEAAYGGIATAIPVPWM